MTRSGSLLLFGAVGAAAYFFLQPRFPKDQSVNVVLGDSASRVTDVAIHYASPSGDDLTRNVALHYAPGGAPRVVHHEARLPDGEYVVDIDVKTPQDAWSTERRVRLEAGSSTSIDVAERGR